MQPCPVDCELAAFSPWSQCTKSCGTGSQHRRRTEITDSLQVKLTGGAACGALEETQSCSTQLCADACVVSLWGAWEKCSRSCGTGIQNRARSIISEAKNGGAPCPHLATLRRCDTHACPTDCHVSEFSEWTPCSRSCGGGRQERTRGVSLQPVFGGAPCAALAEDRACNTELCPQDCTMHTWGTWPACTKTCGEHGSRSRSRTVKAEADGGGKVCGQTLQMQACNEQACPRDCHLTDWSDWGHCSVACGTGTQSRRRIVVQIAGFGGKYCAQFHLHEDRPCDRGLCPGHAS